MPFLQLDQISLFYELWGCNDPERGVIVLVHSKKCPSLLWFQQIPFFVRNGYSVLTFDMRGFGRSLISPPLPSTASFEELIHPRHFPEDLASLMDHLGITSAHVCCLALGGWTGLPFAIRYPQKLRSLILCATPGGLIPDSIRRDREACELKEGFYSGLNQPFTSIPSAAALSAHLEDIELAPGFATRFPERALLWRQMCRSHLSPFLVPDYGRLMYAASVSPEDARMITIPVLMISSDQDLSWTVQSLNQIASMIGPSGASFVCVQGAGHSIPFELPDLFNEIILQFVSTNKTFSASFSSFSSSSSSLVDPHSDLLELDQDILHLIGVTDLEKTSGGLTPTLNDRGYQMSTANPLLEEWIAGYDGVHPVADIGCAYGLNTFLALTRGIPCFAIDMESKHVQYTRSKWDKYCSSHPSASDIGGSTIAQRKGLLRVVQGSLPTEFGKHIADGALSSILMAEVIHFLTGEEIEEAFRVLALKLTQGGRLCVTCVNCDVEAVRRRYGSDIAAHLQHRIETIPKYPGEMPLAQLLKEHSSSLPKWSQSHLRKVSKVKFLHFIAASSLLKTAEDAQFELVSSSVGTHPGYPRFQGQLVENANLTFIFKKKKIDRTI